MLLALVGTIACTDLQEKVLDEQLGSTLVSDPTNIESLINPPYASLRHTIEWYDYWALQEMTTDETITPTRGTDWGDNGAWIQLYLHTWTPDHIRTNNAWNALNQGVSRANTAIYYIGKFPQTATTAKYIFEARFLRVYFMYLLNDMFGQVPYREPSDINFSVSPKVLNQKDAADYFITELKAIIPNLQTKAAYGSDRVTVGAAQALLAKIYLNYGVYSGGTTTKWTETIDYCNQLINSTDYAVTSDYWSMFQKDVAEHQEFIFRIPMTDAVNLGSGSVWVNFTLHYSQVFGNITSTWNGPSTTSTFLNTWDQVNDGRFHDDRIKATCGFNQGFLIGQQYGLDGSALKQRNGDPLIFTPAINLQSSNEAAGIRVVKFAPNPSTINQFTSPNDVPVMRISDIYLIRAEAELRSGNAASALADVNYIRTRRSAAGKTLPLLASVTLDNILNERGFELYWEGLRRQDLIRFGTYNGIRDQKPATSPATTSLFPIPTTAVAVNKNLKQNPGY
jgi:hypothetical protein